MRRDDGVGLALVGTRVDDTVAGADEGETYSVVAAHLPDVLSLRAAVLP